MVHLLTNKQNSPTNQTTTTSIDLDTKHKGFLPYVDGALSNVGSNGGISASAGGVKSVPRNNHAIWDHIGLLHWLKHNVNQFNGEPHNVTFLALDNHAALFLQLLSFSPLAKGE